MPTSTSARSLLALYPHLTDRDRHLLSLLDDHQVLSTSQLHRFYFGSNRTCQVRLGRLHQLGLLDRFRFARTGGGSQPWHWVLGLTGARFQAARTGRAAPTERTHRDYLLRLTASTQLPHLLATNEFFARLAHAARSSGDTRLDRWWSDRTTAAKFLGIKPDGHALWTTHERATGMFLECDRGTEALTRLTGKLGAYTRLAQAGGPRYPVLFWLHSAQREENLHTALRRLPPPVPVATATHDADPAGAVWLPAGGWQRVPLHELASDHGPDSARNPNWDGGELDLPRTGGFGGLTEPDRA